MTESAPIPQVTVNERAMARLRSGHVWVYESDVVDDGAAQPGAMVHVAGPKSKLLRSALYSSSSQIRLRLLSREQLRSEADLLQLTRQRLAEAVAYRSQVVCDSNAYRLVFSEPDLLPGLIVDRYTDIFTAHVLPPPFHLPHPNQP